MHLIGTVAEILDYREGYIRLERHQPPARICKGDYIIRYQKILVIGIQIVLLKLAHPIGSISRIEIHLLQAEHRSLALLHQFVVNLHLSVSYSFFALSFYHFNSLKSIEKAHFIF